MVLFYPTLIQISVLRTCEFKKVLVLYILPCSKFRHGSNQKEVQSIDYSWNKIIIEEVFLYFKTMSYCLWGGRLTAIETWSLTGGGQGAGANA